MHEFHIHGFYTQGSIVHIRKNFDIVRNLCFAPRNFIDDSGKVEGRRRARKTRNVHYCVRDDAQ